MFKVSARTVLELGSELISSDIIALYELIKNGFDARTTSGVEIHFNVVLRRNAYLSLKNLALAQGASVESVMKEARKALEAKSSPDLFASAQAILDAPHSLKELGSALDQTYALNTILVSDTGAGMSAGELNRNFLVLGTPSRKRDVDQALRSGCEKSPYLGEKGIGRLSAMRIGNRLRVETANSQDTHLNILEIDWSSFDRLDAMIEDIEVSPIKGGAKPSLAWSGTKIIMSDLSEDWTEQRVGAMVQNDFARLTDPFLDQKDRPRIVVYWNGERLTIPWMDQNLLKSAHARITGTYAIVDGQPQLTCKLCALDLGFPHPREEENFVLYGPDLQGVLIGASQSQNLHDDALIRVGPFSFEAHWFNRRRLGGIDGIGELKVVRELQKKWSGILLFRDGFRVFPYGEDDDDWLALDRRALGRSGYALNKTQFVGRVTVSRTSNPELVDQTNREGLRVTPEQQVLVGVMQYVINDALLNFLKQVEKQYKAQKVDLSEAKAEVTDLEERAKTALRKLKSIAPKDGKEAIEDLQQAILEFADFADRARKRIAEVEEESHQMIEMAGVGLMVEVVAHELARASENALENLELLRRKAVPEDVKALLASLRVQMKSLSKRVRILDPLSISGRQRSEVFDMETLIREILEAHEGQFKRHGIEVSLDLPENAVQVRAVKGMIVQIVENLISNSKYWMQMRREREPATKSIITIALHDGPPTIIYEDTGRGIAPENRDKVFKAFFSLKEKSKRRGLGLFIARECAQYNGGTLNLDDHVASDTGRLHRFTLELPSKASVQ
jgi:signal transduction histidine kinase